MNSLVAGRAKANEVHFLLGAEVFEVLQLNHPKFFEQAGETELSYQVAYGTFVPQNLTRIQDMVLPTGGGQNRLL